MTDTRSRTVGSCCSPRCSGLNPWLLLLPPLRVFTESYFPRTPLPTLSLPAIGSSLPFTPFLCRVSCRLRWPHSPSQGADPAQFLSRLRSPVTSCFLHKSSKSDSGNPGLIDLPCSHCHSGPVLKHLLLLNFFCFPASESLLFEMGSVVSSHLNASA